MAHSPAHRFGQIIGETLERAIRPILQKVADEIGLYLDSKGKRPARGAKLKVTWVDGRGNAHDLDYVLESGGSDAQIGSPRAFIEIAWRRYTKHSRNKAQEIQGAILPLAERYAHCHPFLGMVLAGVFTEGSLRQLRSHGFHVIYFPLESVVAAFESVGIDAAFDEDTPDSVLLRSVRRYQRLPEGKREGIAAFLRVRHEPDLKRFTESLRIALTRTISSIQVLPLHGRRKSLTSIEQAITFIEEFDESRPGTPFARYEVTVRYSNGDEIRGQFFTKVAAVEFLGNVR